MRDGREQASQLGLTSLAEFIFYSISGGGTCITDLLLLENSLSNSQVTKRIQYDALFTRALVQ